MYVKVFIVNVNKRLKPFFLEQHINIVNRVTLQGFGLSLLYSRMIHNKQAKSINKDSPLNRSKRHRKDLFVCLVFTSHSTCFQSYGDKSSYVELEC